MSHEIDYIYDLYDESHRRARKEHICSACADIIRRGDQYTHIRTIGQGSVDTINRCARCQAIHEHLRGLGYGSTWPAEELDCGEDYEEHWGETPDEIAALAFVSSDEMQTALAAKALDGLRALCDG